MHYLLLLVAIVNVIAVLFFAALYGKRTRIDSNRRTTEEAYKAGQFANTYFSI